MTSFFFGLRNHFFNNQRATDVPAASLWLSWQRASYSVGYFFRFLLLFCLSWSLRCCSCCPFRCFSSSFRCFSCSFASFFACFSSSFFLFSSSSFLFSSSKTPNPWYLPHEDASTIQWTRLPTNIEASLQSVHLLDPQHQEWRCRSSQRLPHWQVTNAKVLRRQPAIDQA